MSRILDLSTKYKRDLKRILRRGKDNNKLNLIIEKLLVDGELDSRYKPHPLRGRYKGYFECHIEPDWLLIYEITDDTVYLARTGSHADLF